MRPLQFPRLAPNTGLTLGNAAASGLNNAMNNFYKMKMQQNQMQLNKAHMAAMQQQAQGMAAWRQAQAESLRQKSMGAEIEKVQLYQSMKKAKDPNGDPIFDPGTLKKFESKHLDEAVSMMNPQERQAAIQRFNSDAEQGKMSPEFQQYTNLNPSEAQLYSKGYSADTSAAARKSVATTQAGARVQSAQISADAKPSPGDRADFQSMKDLAGQMKQTSNNLASLDKPPAFGAIPIDDSTKSALKQKYTSDLADLHQQYLGLHNKLSSGDTQTPAQGNQSQNQQQPPKVFPWDQRAQAGVGDYVAHPNGQGFGVVTGKDSSGLQFSPQIQSSPPPTSSQPASQAQPPMAPSQPTAPTQTAVPTQPQMNGDYGGL